MSQQKIYNHKIQFMEDWLLLLPACATGLVGFAVKGRGIMRDVIMPTDESKTDDVNQL